MPTRAQLQAKYDRAFDNYLSLTKLLREDLESMLDTRPQSHQWRRNFIRTAAAMLEGHAHCLRDLCMVALHFDTPALTERERAVLVAEKSVDANERIKLTLRAAYKLHSLAPAPDFGGREWKRAQRVLRKRHRLMHPKRPRDLGVKNRTWSEIRGGTLWLMKQFFDFLALAQAKYGG
jgi:hypothetical protein